MIKDYRRKLNNLLYYRFYYIKISISIQFHTIKLSIDTLFTAIKNGTWHSIDGLSNQLAIPIEKLKELSRFLSNSGLIKYEENNSRIKIQPNWTPIIQIEETKKTPQNIIANFIIPPHTSINIQSTHISNMSNIEIEVNLRIDNKIREMTIEV